MFKQKNKQRGITLIALVVTIIILIILAGVSINMIVGDNGIITQAQRAAEDTKQAQEKESIQLAILENELSGTELQIGTTLYSKTQGNGTRWHILTNKNDGTSYGDGWIYIPENTSISGFGQTTQNWLVHSQTGEMIAIHMEDYIETYYGMNLAVTEGLLLNVDPVNMEDEDSWGEGVTLYGVMPGDGYGYNGDAILFDGVNDYIEIYADTPIDKGFTFEFYGKSGDELGDIFMLSKSVLGDVNNYSRRFRIGIAGSHIFDAAFSNYPCESDWVFTEGSNHWIRKELNTSFQQEGGNYITMTVNLETNTMALYINGNFLGSTVCSHDWLVNGELTDNTVPFTVGLRISGSEYNENYSAMELYACRLYDKVLTDEEIADNCETTIAYRNNKNSTED